MDALVNTQLATTHFALPVELWYTILARVLGDCIHQCLADFEHAALNSSNSLNPSKNDNLRTVLEVSGQKLMNILCVSKTFEHVAKDILSTACTTSTVVDFDVRRVYIHSKLELSLTPSNTKALLGKH